MSGEIRFNPDRMRKHADQLTSDFVPQIESARTRLNTDAMIEGGDFSITGNAAGMAYPGALQFAFEDLATHIRVLGEYAENIESSAALYRAAEEHSTVRPAAGGGAGIAARSDEKGTSQR
jgi:antirestriction protein